MVVVRVKTSLRNWTSIGNRIGSAFFFDPSLWTGNLIRVGNRSELSALTKSNKKLAEERKLLSTLLQRRRRHTSYNALSLDGGREEDADGDFDYDERSSDASAPLAMLPLPAVAPASDEGGETSDEDYML